MKYAVRPVLCLIMFFVVSCGEESNDPEANVTNPGEREFENCRVVLSQRENFSDDVYVYDDQGRLKSTHNGESYAAEYTYNASQITLKTYSYGDLATTLTITTDGDGLPLQYVKVYANGINKTQTKTFQYNEQKQLVKTTVTTEGSTTENHTVFQWHEGNMVSESKPDGTKMTKYTYSQKLNQPADWFGEIGVEYGLRSIRNKNRLSSIIQPDGDVFAHTYSEDSEGRIESETIDTPDMTYTKNYSYECK